MGHAISTALSLPLGDRSSNSVAGLHYANPLATANLERLVGANCERFGGVALVQRDGRLFCVSAAVTFLTAVVGTACYSNGLRTSCRIADRPNRSNNSLRRHGSADAGFERMAVLPISSNVEQARVHVRALGSGISFPELPS